MSSPPTYTPTAKFLTPRAASTGPGKDLSDFAIRLFEDPSRILLKGSIRINGRFDIVMHRHPNWLQFSLLLGCAGHFVRDGVQIPVRGTTALAFYPGELHNHDIAPADAHAPGEELNLKIKVDPAWPAIAGRLFQPVTYQIRGELMLIRAMRRLIRLSAVGGDPGPILVARVIEVLCLWPSPAAKILMPDRTATADADLDKPMLAALAEVDRRIASPPSLDELAEIAELSRRHFTRRFHQVFGVTPLAFIAAKRLARAQELLVQADVRISDVADALGFDSLSGFSRWFVKQTGTPPTTYRRSPKSY